MNIVEELAARMAAKRMAAKRESDKRPPAPETNRERAKLIPMHERIEKVLATIPPEELALGIQLKALCERLAGKYRGCAQAGEVGKALRQLGWVRVRKWRGDSEGFRATWHKQNHLEKE